MEEKYHLMSVGELLDRFSSRTPTPGGGSAAALLGSVGAALGVMASRFTTGEKFKAHAAEMETAASSLLHLRDELLSLVDADAGAYDRVSAALKLPKASDEEKAQRKQALHEALRGAMQVPFKTMNCSLRCLQILRRHVGEFNANLATDVASAALALGSAMESAWLNILINKTALGDDPEGIKLESEAEKMRGEAGDLTATILATVNEALK